jgi:hypothetical protein
MDVFVQRHPEERGGLDRLIGQSHLLHSHRGIPVVDRASGIPLTLWNVNRIPLLLEDGQGSFGQQPLSIVGEKGARIVVLRGILLVVGRVERKNIVSTIATIMRGLHFTKMNNSPPPVQLLIH